MKRPTLDQFPDQHRFAKPENREFSTRVHGFLEGYEVAESYDSGDIWGSLMDIGFRGCEEATRRGIHVPDELGYRPSICGVEDRDEFDEFFETHDEALESFLSGLDPFFEEAKQRGLDY